jgi:aspartate aminotransferase
VVKAAERRLVDGEPTKTYLPITGLPAFNRRVPELVFGGAHPALAEERIATAQTPGGTGALRAFGEVLRTLRPGTRVWISDPTWANHHQVFGAVGMRLESYPYFDTETHGLAFDRLLETLSRVEPGDAVLFHAVCHNPTGVDPTLEQWREIAALLAEREALPVVDFAYQGFAEGLEEDAEAVRFLARELPEAVVCSSYSKTFGLYRERVGALMMVAGTAEAARALLSQAKRAIRAAWSNPPAHGGQVVAEILGDGELERRWRDELRGMRERIAHMRRRLSEGLDAHGVRLSPEGNDFLAQQRGMFSFTGLSREQVDRLREEHGVYLVGSGRINVAGLNEENLDRVCAAVAAVMG